MKKVDLQINILDINNKDREFSEEYYNENKQLLKYYLDNTFFKEYKLNNNLNYINLELNISPGCDLKCDYCYLSKYGKDLYRINTTNFNKNIILQNLEKVIDFIIYNKYTPQYELYTGDFFFLPYVEEILELFYNKYKNIDKKYKLPIVLPTNMSFLKKDYLPKEKIKNIFKYFDKFVQIDMPIVLSASIDGIFLDVINRPSKIDNTKYTYDNFYNNLQQYVNTYKIGLHPMIYSEGIEYWIDNLLWFFETFEKYPYLLEIRNINWSKNQLKSLYYFLRFIINFLFIKESNKNYKTFEKKFLLSTRLNILNIFTKIGRGIGCSIQSSLHLQLHDLSISPCHRLGYEEFIAGKLDFKKDKYYIKEIGNFELYLAIMTFDKQNASPCMGCPINQLCSINCLGSNYEITGDVFTNPPITCLLETVKLKAILDGLNDINYNYDKFLYNYKLKSQVYYLNKININKILGVKND